MTNAERNSVCEGWIDAHKAILFKVARAYGATDSDREDLFQEIGNAFGLGTELALKFGALGDDAQLGESMENDKQGERFRILEAALPPSGPIAPNRPRLDEVREDAAHR